MMWTPGWERRLKTKWKGLDRHTRRLYRRILNEYLGWHERLSYEAEQTVKCIEDNARLGRPLDPTFRYRPCWAGIRESGVFGPKSHRRCYRTREEVPTC